MVSWMAVEVECSGCGKKIPVVLGTKNKEEKPVGKCPLCKSDKIKILSVTPKSGEK